MMKLQIIFLTIVPGCALSSLPTTQSRAERLESVALDAGTLASQFDGGICRLPSADTEPWRDVFASIEPFPVEGSGGGRPTKRASGDTYRHSLP